MPEFYGVGGFYYTLPLGEGKLEAGLAVNPERLAAAMGSGLRSGGRGMGRR